MTRLYWDEAFRRFGPQPLDTDEAVTWKCEHDHDACGSPEDCIAELELGADDLEEEAFELESEADRKRDAADDLRAKAKSIKRPAAVSEPPSLPMLVEARR